MQRRKFQIFRSGLHTDSVGRTNLFTEDDLQKMELAFNRKSGHRAKVFLGHQPDDYPHSYGEVELLERQGSVLYAEAQIADEMIGAVRSGQCKYCSASFSHPTSQDNPVPGSYTLRHVAILGDQRPGVKGLAPLAFSEGSMQASFADPVKLDVEWGNHQSPLEFCQRTVYDEDSMKLHRQAMALSRDRKVSYAAAVFAIVQERQQ